MEIKHNIEDMNYMDMMRLQSWFYSNYFEEYKKFLPFSAAIIEDNGIEYFEETKRFYIELFEKARFKPNFEPQLYDSLEYVISITKEEMRDYFPNFRKDLSLRKGKLFRERERDIDDLIAGIERYQNTKGFMRLANFYARFHYLGTYNATLVDIQFPGAVCVLPETKWHRIMYRKLVENPRYIATLIPFGPILWQFDISSTVPIDSSSRRALSQEEVLETMNNLYRITTGAVSEETYRLLLRNMEYSGIIVDENYDAVSTYGAYIQIYKGETMHLKISSDMTIPYHSFYLVSVNRNLSRTEKFAAICHELGHLFLRHIDFYDADVNFNNSYLSRPFNITTKEFEAEAVSYIVTKRYGINSTSEKYLSNYIDTDTPYYNLSLITKAADWIERLFKTEDLKYNKTPPYLFNKPFKDRVEEERNMLGLNKKRKPKKENAPEEIRGQFMPFRR